MRALNVGDMVRVGDRWTEVKGFRIIDEHKHVVLAGAVAELPVPASRVRWDPKKCCYVLQDKNTTESKAV